MATEVVQGAADLKKKLDTLDKKVASKLERKGTRDGTKVFADKIRSRVPFDSGLYKSSITVRALKRKKGRIGYRVTVNTKGKGGRKAAKSKRAGGGFYTTSKAGKTFFYPAIIEYGAEGRPAQAPMRQGFDAGKGQALDKVITSIREGIRDATGK